MVLMAGASDHHHHHATAKPASPAAASPSPTPTPAPANRTRLHDFAFPTLSWGAHRLLRCSKDGAGGPASPPLHPHTPSPDKEKHPHQHPQGSSPGAASASQPPRPWNLRTRRSATVAPLASRSDAAGKAPAAGGQAQQQPPLASPPPAAAVPRKRAFSAALTRDEIAEDFAAIRGTRPPRRPKKRPRAVQRLLDMLYPGLSLADVNLDSYKIDEVPCSIAIYEAVTAFTQDLLNPYVLGSSALFFFSFSENLDGIVCFAVLVLTPENVAQLL
ncbi:unnamed protein product [Miscanthus lutarioriparius]|uniref:Uncharacterized protein n=1 Tax=Miscanthus lutarioriparius TaxID=422564 RepID=A0A811RNE7_9POAL|nr:unnamed protein product [Miscanthus lutarioriparius]